MDTTNHHPLGFSPPPGAVKPLDGLDVEAPRLRRRQEVGGSQRGGRGLRGMRLGSARGQVDFHGEVRTNIGTLPGLSMVNIYIYVNEPPFTMRFIYTCYFYVSMQLSAYAVYITKSILMMYHT